MRLDNQELMEEFYSTVKDEFPDVDFEQLKDICFGPWRFVKQEMESGELPSIRLKYFGTFQVYPGRCNNMLYHLQNRFNKGLITEEFYLKYKTMIENRLKNIKDE